MQEVEKIARRGSFSQIGAGTLQSPVPFVRRSSFNQKDSNGLMALQAAPIDLIAMKEQLKKDLEQSKLLRDRAVSFEQSELQFKDQKKFYKPRQRMPKAKQQSRCTKESRQMGFASLGAEMDDEEVDYEPARGRIKSEKILIVEDDKEEDNSEDDDNSTYLSGQEEESDDSGKQRSIVSWCSQASPMPSPMPAPMPKPDNLESAEKAPQTWLELKSRNSSDGHYLKQTMAILPAIREENIFYKQHVGTCIFPFVQAILGLEAHRAPKVTGMLIELPIQKVRDFMQDYETLSNLAQTGSELLQKQEKDSAISSDLTQCAVIESKA